MTELRLSYYKRQVRYLNSIINILEKENKKLRESVKENDKRRKE